MPNNQSMLEQILSAALSNGGLRGAAPVNAPAGDVGNLGDVLGNLLGGLTSGGAMPGGQPGSTGAGGLGDLLGSLTSGGAMPGGQPGSTGLGGLGDLLGGLASGGAMQGGQPGSAGTGGLGDLLGGILSGSGRSAADQGAMPAGNAQPAAPQGNPMGELARYGGLAVIGVLAYKAFKRYQAEQQGGTGSGAADAMPAPDSGFHPENQEGGVEVVSGALLNAMICAAQADGVIDEDELRRLTGQLDKLAISPNDRQALVEQLRRRVNPADVINSATSPELAVQIYTASALAISIDTPKERSYLDKLADAIGIDPELKTQVEAAVGRA